MTTTEPNMQAAARRFFASPYFAVVGASQDTRKFGYKILSWYTHHSLPVTPINPTTRSITIHSTHTPHPTLPSITQLPHPTQTALSFLTPPRITRLVLSEAKGLGVKHVWLQPGSFDADVMAYAMDDTDGTFESVVGGFGPGTVGGEGWCVLVDGEGVMGDVGRDWRGGGGSGSGRL